MKTKSILNRRVQLALGAAILASLVVGAISYRSMVAASESDLWVRHTHEVLETLQNLLAAMGNIESRYRGFALTGKESYLESYHASTLTAEQGQATVRNLTVDNPKQETLIPTLERLAAQKIQFGERVISLRQTTGLEAAADAIRSGTDERVIGEFQGVVRQMQDEELRLLVLRDAEAKRRVGQTKTILILGTVLGLVIAIAAGWSVQRDNSRRGRAEEALRDSEEKFGCSSMECRTMPSLRSTRMGWSPAGMPAPNGSRATEPTRSSDRISRASIFTAISIRVNRKPNSRSRLRAAGLRSNTGACVKTDHVFGQRGHHGGTQLVREPARFFRD
jgi:CHASE3 domain sensor protein